MLCGTKRKIGGSIGIASYPKDTDNLEQLIVCADDAMYQVKKNGKNDFAFYKKARGRNNEHTHKTEIEQRIQKNREAGRNLLLIITKRFLPVF